MKFATYLAPEGVHYNGNQRFESGTPVLVDDETAKVLAAQVNVNTSTSPSGVATPLPMPMFKIEDAPEAAPVAPVAPVAPLEPALPAAPARGRTEAPPV